MHELNFQHLRYFWVTAREGGVSKAATRLRLAPSTVSSQIKALEEILGQALFARKGRGLVLTPFGRIALEYADRIFTIGEELLAAVQTAPGQLPIQALRVGALHAVPTQVVAQCVAPGLQVDGCAVPLSCTGGDVSTLLASLSTHDLDLILSDRPLHPHNGFGVSCTLLAECGVSLMAAPSLARTVGSHGIRQLDGCSIVMPAPSTALRDALENWFSRHKVCPNIVGEAENFEMLVALGRSGLGLFPVCTMMEDHVTAQHGAVPVMTLRGISTRYYGVVARERAIGASLSAILEGTVDAAIPAVSADARLLEPTPGDLVLAVA